jgi:hypothetical protein
MMEEFQEREFGWVLEAHTCNMGQRSGGLQFLASLGK